MATSVKAAKPARHAKSRSTAKKQNGVRKLSSKDREIQQFLKILPDKGTATDVPIPRKVELSVETLNRLADHCERHGKKLSYHGLRIV